MTKVTLTLLALAALAACEATMTSTGPADPTAEEYDRPAEGADPPGAQGPNASPWWSV